MKGSYKKIINNQLRYFYASICRVEHVHGQDIYKDKVISAFNMYYLGLGLAKPSLTNPAVEFWY